MIANFHQWWELESPALGEPNVRRLNVVLPELDHLRPALLPRCRSNEATLIFTGHVVPERAAITIGPITFGIGANPDLPQSTLHLEILLSQIHARLVCPTPPSNIFTARNIVVDARVDTLFVRRQDVYASTALIAFLDIARPVASPALVPA
jgi:hypothetical protein